MVNTPLGKAPEAESYLKTSPPQSNLRRARRSSADKTSSKLLGLHSPSMLSTFKTSLTDIRLDSGLGIRVRMPVYAVQHPPQQNVCLL